MKQINVLYVASDNYKSSGAFLQMVDLALKMRENHNVNPLIVVPCKGEGVELLKKHNLKFLRIPSENWVVSINPSSKQKRRKIKNSCFKNILAVLKFIYVIKKHHIDIVHINTVWTYAGAVSALCTNTKLVWHIREALHSAISMKILFSWGKKLINKADKIISISSAVLNSYPEMDKTKSVVVYDGINEKKYMEHKTSLFSKEKIRMACIGEVYVQKGQFDLIDACTLLVENNIKNWHLSFVGGGNLKELQRRIEERKLKNFIDVLGQKDNVYECLQETDIGICPSHFEGFGRVAAEITMAGCLLVCSDAGAFEELYKDKWNALVHKVKSPQSIYETIKWALSHTEECKKIAETGCCNAQNRFTSTINAQNVYNIYKEVI